MISSSASAPAMRARYSIVATIGLAFVAGFMLVVNASAAEIKVSTARLIATVLREVGRQFELETGHQLKVTDHSIPMS
jgi:hypothetical protein